MVTLMAVGYIVFVALLAWLVKPREVKAARVELIGRPVDYLPQPAPPKVVSAQTAMLYEDGEVYPEVFDDLDA